MTLIARLAGHSSILGVATTIISISRCQWLLTHVEKYVEKYHEKRSLLSKTKLSKANLTNRTTLQIEWGDCDPAQIVHYPRYLAYFDACTTALFKKAGLSKRQMLKTYQIVGIPLVDLRASFKVPSRFSDTVVVESEITGWRHSSAFRPPQVV